MVLVFITTVAHAGAGGSAYSLFGIGDIRYLPSTRSAGMGYTGLGLSSANFINSIQPAAWSRINRTRVETGVLYEGYSSSDGNKSIYLANSSFAGALLAIPISTDNGIVTVLGFTPYSTVNYNFFVGGTLDGIEYEINHAGSGGLSRGIAGLSYSPFSDFAVGASFNYMFGLIDRTTSFSPTYRPSYAGGTITKTSSMHGITVTAGGMFNGFGRIAESLQPFSLGVVATTGSNLKTEQQTKFDFQTESDTLPATNGGMTIPLAYGIGLAYQASDRYLVAADYYAQQWGSATFDGIDPSEIRNSYRIGLGGERLPERDATEWAVGLAYRLGLYYNSTYYKIEGQPINEWGITGGIAIPLFGDARLNTAFEYGIRGTTTGGLVKDKIFRMTFSVMLSEPWFRRYEEE
jgi:hypothetical protein